MPRPPWFVPVLLVALPLTAVAQEEQSAGDLAPGDTAYGQDAGEFELEMEALWMHEADARTWDLRLGLEYGLTSRVQLSLDVPYVFEDPSERGEPSADGLDRAEFAVQVGLLSADAPMALSFALATALPLAGDGGPGDDDVAVSGELLAAWLFGRTEVFAGVSSTWDDGIPELSAEVGVVVAQKRTAVEFELGWSDDPDGATFEFKPGLVVEDVGPFDLGLAAPYVIQPGRDAWGVGVTLTWGFP